MSAPVAVPQFTKGKKLGEGSYKTAYATSTAGQVLITVPKGKLKDLKKEINDLKTLEHAGIRVARVCSDVFEDGDSACVLMERLQGQEVKETRFNMTKEKKWISAVADHLGTDLLIKQLKAIDDYVRGGKNRGISDLQFMVSLQHGFVLFDPATLGTSEVNGGPAQMIAYLEKNPKPGKGS